MNVYPLANTEKTADKCQNSGTSHEISLVDGGFDVNDAQDQLMRIILDNLAYHSIRSFSSEEQYGSADIDSERKIRQLDQFRKDVVALLDIAAKKGVRLNVEASVKVSLS